MTSKRVLRYYCDHCRKGSLSKHTMGKHEAGCTKNPNRVCGLCKTNLKNATGQAQKPLAELVACITLDKPDLGLADLRTAANNCPACILAAIRQTPLRYPDTSPGDDGRLSFEFNFRSELDAWWKNQNELSF